MEARAAAVDRDRWRLRGLGVLQAVGWGLASMLCGMIHFQIPGVTWAAADLREIAVLLSVVYLRHWAYLLIVAAITAHTTPADGSILSTFAMHAAGAVATWFAYAWLRPRQLRPVAVGAAWAAIVVVYYVAILLPVMVVTNAMVGLLSTAELASAYWVVLRSMPYELLATASVTSLFLVTRAELELRRRAETSLRASEAQLSGILAAAPVGIARVAGNRLVWANQQLASLSGYSVEALASMELATLFGGAQLGPDAATGLELALARHDGTRARVLVSTASVTSPDRADAMVLAILDVSERARLEAHLRRVEKMEALGQLAGGVAHDFNNLLTIVTLQVELMRRQAPALGASLDQVAGAVAQGTALIRQLLAFSRREPRAHQRVTLQQVVPATLEMMRPLLGRSVSVAVALDDDAPGILADPSEIEQVVMNLLVNARDAIDAGDGDQRRITIGVSVDGPAAARAAVLTVGDTGIGMDEATRARVLEPFFTTKPEGQGTGLGLATVHRIVDGGHGRIDIESAPGRGSTFRVTWPAHDDA
ncbi:MAG: PAS domain-containing protein [Myxococcales bacterium]|nr:PAS domain-containing protein [Myxococcales bacterium]